MNSYFAVTGQERLVLTKKMRGIILQQRADFFPGASVSILPFERMSPYWRYREVRPLATVILTDAYRVRLSDITEEDIEEEGLSMTLGEYIAYKRKKFNVGKSTFMTKLRWRYD